MDIVYGRRAWVSRLGWTLIGAALLVVGSWVVVSAMHARTTDEFNRWVGWANILALVVGAVGTALVAFDKAGRRRDYSAPDRSGEVAERCLAEFGSAIEQAWSREAVIRQVGPPAPVMVRWSSTGRPAASRNVVLDESESPGWRELPLEGDVGQIVAAFRALPHRQLLVLGDPGAGKTILAMLLTLGLLRRPEPGEPVPVLLSISSWDTGEPIGEFIVRRLVEDFAAVLAEHGEPATLAWRLLGQRRLLPILDGLDELPSERHGEALDALDRFGAEERPFVVTCRGREYDRAVRRQQTILSRAAVIEIDPVGVEAAITFLSYPELGSPRWQQVFRRMRERPKGHLAAALSTPLLVALTRVAYTEPSTSPAELLDLPTRRAVENHLMQAFLTSVYSLPPDPHPYGIRPGSAYKLERAERWLACLAHHLNQTGLRDLRWWQIDPALLARHRIRALIIPLVAAVLGVAAIWGGIVGATQGWWPGARAAATGFIIGVLAVCDVYQAMWPEGYPSFARRLQQARRVRRPATWRLRLGYGIGGGLLTGLLVADLRTTLPAGILCGLLAMSLPTWRPRRRLPRNDPAASFLINRRRVANAVVQHSITAAAVFAVLAWLVGSTPIGSTAVAAAAVYATTAGLAAGGWTWIQFRLAHARLAWDHWLPWRLGAFLDDAHRNGVLRQAGSVYQFRHALLQDHLANRLRKERLREDAVRGNRYSAEKLVELLVEQGAVDEAIELLRVRDASSSWIDQGQLIDLLATRGQVGELRVLADRGVGAAVWRVALHAAENGQVAEVMELLSRTDVASSRIGSGQRDEGVERGLAEVLAAHGHEQELTDLADRGNNSAALELAGLLASRGRVEELRARADGGDHFATWRLVRLLREQGRVEDAITMLRVRVDRGDSSVVLDLIELLAEQERWDAIADLLRVAVDDERFPSSFYATKVADFLAERGRVEELRVLAEAGGWRASERLTPMLIARGRVVEAIETLRAGAKAGRFGAEAELIDLIADPAVVNAAVEVLRASVESGGPGAARQLEELTADLHLVHDEIASLRARARTGDKSASGRLADLLARQGRVIELRARADTGDQAAGERLAELLMKQGHVDELRARADDGDQAAGERLVALLTGRGELDELRARADVGDRQAVEPLVDLLVKRGRGDEAIEFLWTQVDIDVTIGDSNGNGDLPKRLARLLAEQGHISDAARILQALADRYDFEAAHQLASLKAVQAAIEVLRPYADDGNDDADKELAELLAGRGRVRELEQRADAGGWHASLCLAEFLARHGRIDELRRRADADDWWAERLLVDLLVANDDEQALREWAETGNLSALCGLVARYAEQDRLDEAIRVVRSTSNADARSEAARSLAYLLANRERVDEAIDVLQAFTNVEDRSASRRLVDLLARQGRLDEAIEVVLQVLNLEYADVEPVVDVESDPEGSAAESGLEGLEEDSNVEFGGEGLYLGGGDVRDWERCLIDLLAEGGRVDVLRAAADAGDPYARTRLAALLTRLGRVDELRARAVTGDWPAAEQLLATLDGHGGADEAIEILRTLLDGADAHGSGVDVESVNVGVRRSAMRRLADLLALHERVDDLRTLAETDNEYARARLAGLLARLGHVDELRTRADASDPYAAEQLITVLHRRGDTDRAIELLLVWAKNRRSNTEPHRRDLLWDGAPTIGDSASWGLEFRPLDLVADDGVRVSSPAPPSFREARNELVDLLSEQDRIDDLAVLAAASDWYARRQLAALLARLGRTDELRGLSDSGDSYAAELLVATLAREDRIHDIVTILRTRAGDGLAEMSLNKAAERVADSLAGQGRIGDALEVLRALAAAGRVGASARVATHLAERGDIDELRALADADASGAGWRLADQLARLGRVQELRKRADAGDWDAASRLAQLLIERVD
ncbi:NACHT domain-containing protein [Paractinoplanes hotanensis]|uniref:NACHT domain-containing protein n=1 Tax=Paractinoplanes hotanensis TaxID=2906497 RepID=A0ABT0YBK2_9ACTN|nr:NACHT domain-containing protein [Actinoplanes hotanensis]MCM4083413.1 NACHT domain-containing protein [Actinoplanes hotanensis]